MNRREALRLMGGSLTAGSWLCALPSCAAAAGFMSPARFYERLSGLKVRCLLCPKQCVVGDRERGFCGVRENRNGTYYTLVYGQCASVNLDPIEKKPFFHFLPGSGAFSIATAGCNFDCKDCQNWEISQARPEQIRDAIRLLPKDVAAAARRYGASSIAYTYTEPVVFYEYMLDCAQAGHAVGVRSVMVSNGFIRAEPMQKLLPHLDAVKIDLKSVSERFYRDYCVGEVGPVLDTIRLVKQSGKWLEIVYLVVPTLNDSEAEIRKMCEWVRTNVGTQVPLHFSRFYPAYQLKKLPPTPYETMERCWNIARATGLHFVYVGNVPGTPHANTVCPKCGKTAIKRSGYQVLERNLRNGLCRFCGTKIPGVWS